MNKNEIVGFVCQKCKKPQNVATTDLSEFRSGNPIKCWYCRKSTATKPKWILRVSPGPSLTKVRILKEIQRRSEGSYQKGVSCVKRGKKHQYQDRGSYYKCSVCNATKTKPASLRAKVGRL